MGFFERRAETMVTISDLPGDLEWEILSRVPAKSLAKFKTCCKRWYALFRDPKFVEKNLGSKAAVRESILLSNFGVYSIGDDLHGIHNTVDPSIEFTGKLRRREDSEDLKISKIFHCDGLILCATMGYAKLYRLVVWNPCTGQTRLIKPRTRYRCEDYYALGYVKSKSPSSSSSSFHSYKIVRSCRYLKFGIYEYISEFEIYEFSSDSWRVLDYSTRDSRIFCCGMSVKGNAYWVAADEETGLFVLKFDFTTERFERLPLPFQSFDLEAFTALSVVPEEKLSVLHQGFTSFSYEMKIWVSNKIDEEAKDLSWRSDFVLVVDFSIFNLPSYASVSSFLLDEENKVAVCCDVGDDNRSRIYVVGKDMYRQVYKDAKGAHLFRQLLVNYVPSLVRIPKNTLKMQKKRKQKETRGG